VILEGDGRKSVLTVGEPEINVVISGLTVRGGAFQAGGALHQAVRARVKLLDCVLQGNRATSYGGGAIFASRGELEIENCVLADNGGGTGGALLADGVVTVRVRTSTFRGNRGTIGGAVALRDGAEVWLTGTVFEDNLGERSGGASVALQGTTTRGPKLVVEGGKMEDAAIWNEDGRGTVTQR
jgi:hypothetical protein